MWMLEQIPQLLKMPHSLSSAFSQPLPPCPGRRYYHAAVVPKSWPLPHQHNIAALRKDKSRRQQNQFQNKKGTHKDFEAYSAIDQSAQWGATPQTATSCSIYTTTLKSLIYKRMFFTVDSSSDSTRFVRLFWAVHRIPTRMVFFCIIIQPFDRFLFLPWQAWTVINNPLSDSLNTRRSRLMASQTQLSAKWEQDPWERRCLSEKHNVFLLNAKAFQNVSLIYNRAFNCSQSGSLFPTLNH